jgi:HlyD family secretion protein
MDIQRYDTGALGAENRRRGVAQLVRSARERLGTGKLLAAAAAVLLVAVALWWAVHRTAPVKYLTAPVTRGSVARTVVATGTVNPVLTIIIGSYVSGVIKEMYCDYNSRVKKGQLCAKIDPRPYQAALDQARGQLARDTGQLEGARVDLARYAELWGQNSIAKQTYDDQTALVHQLEGSVQLDRAAVENARVNLDYTNITSPVDGTVVARNITIGQTVAASFQTPTLFLIATDLTKMQVDTNVSESDIGAVKEGEDASFTVEALSDHAFPGTVVQVRQAPQTVQNVVTYDVVVGVDNAQALLKPGMTATVSIVTQRRTNVLRIPNQALRFAPSGLRATQPAAATPAGGAAQAGRAPRPAQRVQAWILRDGKPAAVPITIGLDDDTYTEVLAGDLSVNDQVIIGEQRAAAGQRTGTFRFGL